jgi:hypothetical protein
MHRPYSGDRIEFKTLKYRQAFTKSFGSKSVRYPFASTADYFINQGFTLHVTAFFVCQYRIHLLQHLHKSEKLASSPEKYYE